MSKVSLPVINPIPAFDGGCHEKSNNEEEMYVEPDVPSGKGKSSVLGAAVNLVNCVVGAGIIGLPAAVNQCGFATGGLCLCLVAYLLFRSAVLLIECGEKLGKHNFESLAEHLFGPAGYYVTTASMATFAYGSMTAYMVILGDTLPPVFALLVANEVFASRAFLVLMAATFVMLPICMLKSLSDMVWASALSVLADGALICIILTEGPREAKRQNISFDPMHITFIESGIFAGIGFVFILNFADSNALNILLCMPSWSRAVSYSTIVALIFSLTLGLGGYLIFNEHIEGDILNNFESSGVAVSAGKTLLALCMILTYPVECFIARHCVNSLIDYYRSRPYDNLDCRNNSSNISESDMDDHIFCQVMQNITSPNNDYDANLEDEIVEIQLGMKQFCEDKVSNRAQIDNYDDGATASNADHSLLRPNVWHVIITLLLWISSTLLSLVFTDLQIVLSFTGCIAASNLGYIFPALIYFCSYKDDLRIAIDSWKRSSLHYHPSLIKRIMLIKKFIIPMCLLIFGVCVMIIGLLTILLAADHAI